MVREYVFKNALITPENQPLRPNTYFESIGLNVEKWGYLGNSPFEEIEVGMLIWEINLNRGFHLPIYLKGSDLNTVLINSDNLGNESDDYAYDKLCVQTINQVEKVTKLKPTIAMWGETLNLIKDFDMDNYSVIYGVRRDDALISNFKLLLGEKINIHPDKFELIPQSIDRFGDRYIRKRFDPIDFQEEREILKEMCPDVTTNGKFYQLPLDRSLHKKNKPVYLRVSMNGRSYLYDPRTNHEEPVCLQVVNNHAIVVYNDKRRQLSTGGSIMFSLSLGGLDGSVLKNVNKAYGKLVKN
jgi:hypothetical protein